MKQNMKKFVRKNKRVIAMVIICIVALLLCVIVYKTCFYSNSKSSLYGERLREIEKNEFTKSQKQKVANKVKKFAGVNKVDVEVSGRLIKFFITFDKNTSVDNMKLRFNESLGLLSEKVKSYYDVSFYSIQIVDKKVKYPLMGYKHKNSKDISWGNI